METQVKSIDSVVKYVASFLCGLSMACQELKRTFCWSKENAEPKQPLDYETRVPSNGNEKIVAILGSGFDDWS